MHRGAIEQLRAFDGYGLRPDAVLGSAIFTPALVSAYLWKPVGALGGFGWRGGLHLGGRILSYASSA